uniref:Uncharacterized protein n=1 Tax=Euplotes crassus TaxID=5936 RepID=A0A7S3NXP0_EUPCR|mmetsp:Transcript_27996/g.27839  ORF Transcript_27996/g.27839 Transcript_27996/m.27839 type:complete len:111 (+) Transcript_27996:153-485(+)
MTRKLPHGSLDLLKKTISKMINSQQNKKHTRLQRIDEVTTSKFRCVKSKFTDSLDSDSEDDRLSDEYQKEVLRIKEKIVKKIKDNYSNNLINISTESSIMSVDNKEALMK